MTKQLKLFDLQFSKIITSIYLSERLYLIIKLTILLIYMQHVYLSTLIYVLN